MPVLRFGNQLRCFFECINFVCFQNSKMIRSPTLIWTMKQLVMPSAGSVRTAYSKGVQPLAYGHSYLYKWKNEVGEEHLRRIMPDLMKLSRERRSHLWDAEKPDGAGQTGEQVETSPDDDLNETRNLAEVPSFARFAEFRETDLNFRQAKLHCVWRCKAMSGRPKYEKAIMISLKLDSPMHRMVILKNTPAINYKLWLVKHLIRIKPLTFPDGVPDADNFRGFLLKHNGEFVQSRLLRENYKRQGNRPELERHVMLREDQERGMRQKWFDGSINGTLMPTTAADQHLTTLEQTLTKPALGKGALSTARRRSGE